MENNQSFDSIPKSGLLRVSLEIKQFDDLSIFNCILTNIGYGEIALSNTYLFIDTGVYDEGNMAYSFPFIQKKFLHLADVDDKDCIMSDYCKKSICEYPIDNEFIQEFYRKVTSKDVFSKCFMLEHLSSKSILYMAPQETFNETIVLRFEKGVYRAILVSTPNNCDCMCSNQCFYVK